MRKQVIAYLHTHWDREWYREFEVFRMRLLRVFDNVLELLETGKIPCFYFDGQTAALEDYLAIRPEKISIVKTLIRTKKLFIGPFYCLVDEFLTDKTCFSKNLEIGMKYALDMGCTDFIGYLPDTFGHSANVLDILRDFGIDKCVIWRGAGDFPTEFRWCGMDTVNLARGYFHDVFALDCPVEKKAELLKKELDLLSEKSGEYILLPIGADHLGVPKDIDDQIISINDILKDEYFIKLSSPFEYFKKVENNFKQFEFNDELRDNSKTFILPGVYSSRLDLKRYNIECTHKLDLASRYVKFSGLDKKYSGLIEYAYKLLLQNQAHDGICGCSTDDVHFENISRYKKVLQIAETIVDEIKFDTRFEENTVLNLADTKFSGVVEFETTKQFEEFEKLSSKNGFDKKLLNDTLRIPITEDYTKINTYLDCINSLNPDETGYLQTCEPYDDLIINDNQLENSNISLKIENEEVFINSVPFSLIDFIDKGDSYNNGPVENDKGTKFKLLRSKVVYKGRSRGILKLDFDGGWDTVSLKITLDKNSTYLKFEFDWVNTRKNHLLEASFELKEPIREVFSEDMNILIKRNFEPGYDIRKNLPQKRGIEAKTNTAPMQRGLLVDEKINNIGVVTKGLTQYEILNNNLLIPILRATGQISNPLNPARSTPAGPPIENSALQMIGENKAEFYVFFGNKNAFDDVLNQVYNYLII